jgi:hypothetical protein
MAIALLSAKKPAKRGATAHPHRPGDKQRGPLAAAGLRHAHPAGFPDAAPARFTKKCHEAETQLGVAAVRQVKNLQVTEDQHVIGNEILQRLVRSQIRWPNLNDLGHRLANWPCL